MMQKTSLLHLLILEIQAILVSYGQIDHSYFEYPHQINFNSTHLFLVKFFLQAKN